MKAHPSLKKIFKEASVTHYYSTMLFPGEIREEITILYAFVRTVDDIVDEIADQEIAKKKFYEFRKEYRAANRVQHSDNLIIDQFAKLKQLKKIPDEYVESLFTSMEWDLDHKRYETIADLEKYMYGVAVVIGLMMNRIFEVPAELDKYAFAQGFAAQWANILRDIGKDLTIGRVYLPNTELRAAGFHEFSIAEVAENSVGFAQAYSKWMERLTGYLADAKPGLRRLPWRLAVPIKTSSDMYLWSVEKLAKQPDLIFHTVLKPPKWYVISIGIRNLLAFCLRIY